MNMLFSGRLLNHRGLGSVFVVERGPSLTTFQHSLDPQRRETSFKFVVKLLHPLLQLLSSEGPEMLRGTLSTEHVERCTKARHRRFYFRTGTTIHASSPQSPSHNDVAVAIR